VIRIVETPEGTLLDARSTSRVGLSDVGKNAARLRAFCRALTAGEYTMSLKAVLLQPAGTHAFAALCPVLCDRFLLSGNFTVGQLSGGTNHPARKQRGGSAFFAFYPYS